MDANPFETANPINVSDINSIVDTLILVTKTEDPETKEQIIRQMGG